MIKHITLPKTDLSVSEICYGTATLGVNMEDLDAFALIDAFRDAGGNFLDTAHVYACWTKAGAGSSECTIARYVKANGGNDLVIATKGGHPGMPGYRRVDRRLDPCRVHADIEDSLGRLDVDTIDLYYLHRDDTRFGVEEIIDTLNDEIDAGTIRYIGASNWTRKRLEAANAYADQAGKHGFVVSEVEFSLAWKETPAPKDHGGQTLFAQEDDLDYHRRSGLPMCPFASTGRGYFAEGSAAAGKQDSPVNRRRLEPVRSLAKEKGCTPTQVALAWLRHLEFPCIPITGTTSLSHLRENLAAVDVTLTTDEMRTLTEA